MAMRRLIFMSLIAPLWLVTAGASEAIFESGPTKVHLLELYTSEGCSSCPPAEAWLGKLKENKRLWRDFVPVAFHVDYWDRLGWRDRFASKEWTQRQQILSARWNSGTVYTPAFVLDGNESRAVEPDVSHQNVGVLRLKLSGDEARVSFTPHESGFGVTKSSSRASASASLQM